MASGWNGDEAATECDEQAGRFSRRVPAVLRANRLTQALDARRRGGAELLDLTVSNPSCAGIAYPPGLLMPLADPAGTIYRPEPFGLASARRAVAGDYARRGILVSENDVVLTASTSEAYSLLFKVLCDPGDEVLVPAPSYPLFEHLASLEAVVIRPYGLAYDGHWSVVWDSVREAMGPRTRAVLLVSPNNPTGSFLRRDDWARWRGLAVEHRWSVIADEVFCDYPLEPAGDHVACVLAPAEGPGPLTVALGGLSKSVGLPSVKLGWMALSGDASIVSAAKDRLEIVCDTYLSVSTPVQHALPALLRDGVAVREQIAARIRENLSWLEGHLVEGSPCSLLSCEGGWSAAVRVPALLPEDDLVVRLIEEQGVVVHPGYFFDFAHEAFLITSLLPRPATVAEGWRRITAFVNRLM
jgi:aspartate/methionine/tyrosine aminotransferase